MSKIKSLFVVLLLVGAFTLPACSGSSSFDNTPDQSDVDFAFQAFIFDLEDLVDFLDFFGVSNCTELETFINDLIGTELCDDGGSSTISIDSFVCDDGPPLTASFNITQGNNECSEGGDFSDGTLTAAVTFNGSIVTINTSASAIIFNNLLFSFSGFIFTEDSSFNVTCLGIANVNNDTCTAAANCSGCQLN